jgi:hypothetical protein
MYPKIRVLSVQSILSPGGERRISVVLGLECPIPVVTEKKPAATSITITPGMHTPIPQIPLENKVILFFTEEEWKKIKNRLSVDDEYKFDINENGEINLRRT